VLISELGHANVILGHQAGGELELAGEAARSGRGVVWGAGIHSVVAWRGGRGVAARFAKLFL
jgi:hypothetical protein